ncbi:MAG: alpha/beta hydrolase [Pseudomonas sp.]
MMNWIEVNGGVLRYQLRRASASAQVTTVLIHEMGGSLESWNIVCAGQPADMTLLRYDTRSAGLSEKVMGELDIDTHVADLAALLDALAIQQPVALAGVAVGAAIAIRFAARYPQRVSHVLAMAPACGVAAEARAGALATAQRIRQEGLRQLLPALLEKTWPEPLRSDPQVFHTYRNRWLAADPEGFAATFSMLAGLALEADLPRLPARTLLVAGQYDGLRPPAEIQRLAAFAPHIEALTVASGHFMPVQSPQLVLQLLRQFIVLNRSGAAIYQEFIAHPPYRVGAAGHAA